MEATGANNNNHEGVSVQQTTPGSSRLLRLPTELRYLILVYVFSGALDVQFMSRYHGQYWPSGSEPAIPINKIGILLACKQLRQEALPIFYEHSTFRLSALQRSYPIRSFSKLRRVRLWLDEWDMYGRMVFLDNLLMQHLNGLRHVYMHNKSAFCMSTHLWETEPRVILPRYHFDLARLKQHLLQGNQDINIQNSFMMTVCFRPVTSGITSKVNIDVTPTGEYISIHCSREFWTEVDKDAATRAKWQPVLAEVARFWGLDIGNMTISIHVEE